MRHHLGEILRTHEPGLTRAWCERVRRSSPRYAERPEADLLRAVEDALRTVRTCVEEGGSEAARTYAARLAPVRLDEGFHQADTLRAFFLGWDLLLELVHEQVEPERRIEAVHRLDDAFHAVVSSYSASFCSLCTARQEERRARLEMHLASVVERSRDAMILFEPDGRVVSWNAGAHALLGYEPAEIVGQSFDRVLPAEHRASLYRLLDELGGRDHVREAEMQLERRNGKLVWVDAAFTAVRASEGEPLGIWAIFRDITSRKQLEEEKLHAERLALVGTLSAKLAHEVRNPLNSLVLGVDLVRDNLHELAAAGERRAGESLELLASVESELQRIHRVVEHYLRFAHLPKVQLEPLALDPFLRGRLELLRTDLERSRIEFELALDAGATTIAADAHQLWQAVLNLIRNAMDAMPNGGRLRVATARDGGRVELRVEDTGGGMTQEVQANLYRPFYSTKSAGTGLGMALTRQILREHGATIECESAPDRGTRFLLQFEAEPPAGRNRL